MGRAARTPQSWHRGLRPPARTNLEGQGQLLQSSVAGGTRRRSRKAGSRHRRKRVTVRWFGGRRERHLHSDRHQTGPRRSIFEAIQPPDSDPMLNFDERDLISDTEAAGFDDIHLELTHDVRRAQPRPWAAVLNIAANPLVPTLAEAMGQAPHRRGNRPPHRLPATTRRARSPWQATHRHRLPLSAAAGRITRNRKRVKAF
jgi:hypothetical protein